MRVWVSIAGILLGMAVGGLLIGLLGGVVWARLSDDDSDVAVAEPTPAASQMTGSGSPASDESAGTPTVTPPPIPPTATVVPFEAITISGDGDQTAPLPTLSGGIGLLSLSYEGDEHFRAELRRGEGKPTTVLANVDSTWEGSRAVFVGPDQQAELYVTAKGPWEVTVDRPAPSEENLLPIPFERAGSGSQAIYYVDVPQGMHTITATHTGKGKFVVNIMNDVGRMRSKPIDVSGDYSDSVEFESKFFPTSRLVLDVRAAGDWTIKIE